MLFFVQMKWNYQGRISQDQLWDIEAMEGEHGIAGIRAGFVQLYKVVSQHRVIAIAQVDSLDDLDRNSMGWLPMREYLEFEKVWALRDYEGFVEDVKAKFPRPGQPVPRSGSPKPAETREIAAAWFARLGEGKLPEALQLLDDDVIWDNIPPTPGLSDVAPWLGSHRGLPAVRRTVDLWAAHSRMLSCRLVGDLMVDGDRATGVVQERGQCVANGNEYDLSVATMLRIRDRKITEWRMYWDSAPLVRAFRNL